VEPPPRAPDALLEDLVRRAVTDQEYEWDSPHLVSALRVKPDGTGFEFGTVGVIDIDLGTGSLFPLFQSFAVADLGKRPDKPPYALFARLEVYLRTEAEPDRGFHRGDKEALYACAADVYGGLWWARCERGQLASAVKVKHCAGGHRHNEEILDALWATARGIGSVAYGMMPPTALN
jgi:hypothetical protein